MARPPGGPRGAPAVLARLVRSPPSLMFVGTAGAADGRRRKRRNVMSSHTAPPGRPRLPDARFWEGKEVCVTGGTGFLGYQIVRQLLDLGARVRVLALPPEDRH